jgi:integrase
MSERNLGILLCLFTGMRVGEICALKWEDFSFQEKSIHVHNTMQRLQIPDSTTAQKTRIMVTSPKSKCSIRTIPIPDSLIQLIQKEFPNRQGYVLAAVNEKYIEPRTMQKYFHYVQKQCGLVPVNFHALRHTFATRCIELGFDVKSLSEILGHATVNITLNRYVHPSMELKQQNMQKLSSLLAVI